MKTIHPKHHAPKVTARADEALAQIQMLNNPYFTSLRDGTMPLDCFRKTQQQFYFAVLFFARPMAALVARIPNPRIRLDILHNVVEEHGDFDSHKFHETTFKNFLRSIQSDTRGLERMELWPELRAFNSVLATACLHDEVETAVACMGIIEYAFADISAIIGNAVVERGWVKPAKLVHYKLHSRIDKRHAQEFFAIVEPSWRDKTKRYFIEQGLELGAYIFDRLYRDMHTKGMRR